MGLEKVRLLSKVAKYGYGGCGLSVIKHCAKAMTNVRVNF